MIVIDKGKHWQIIFQRTHAQLAADVAYNIDQLHYPEEVPFPSLLTAIADHDDGRQQWEGRLHITADGAPMDYRQQSLDLKIQQANKSIANSQYRSPWIGLLTSMHEVQLYSIYAEKNLKVAAFIERQEDYQKRVIKLLNIKPEIQEQAYNFLRFCDELSLILCEERLELLNDPLKLGELPQLNSCNVIKQNDNSYTLNPWCFEDRLLTLSAYIYKIPKIRFNYDKELLDLIRNINPIRKNWNLSE